MNIYNCKAIYNYLIEQKKWWENFRYTENTRKLEKLYKWKIDKS